MKVTEAALIVVLILGIITVGTAIVVSAARRNPGLERRLAEAERERDRLKALLQTIYGASVGSADADPLASYIAGEIDQARGRWLRW